MRTSLTMEPEMALKSLFLGIGGKTNESSERKTLWDNPEPISDYGDHKKSRGGEIVNGASDLSELWSTHSPVRLEDLRDSGVESQYRNLR